MLKFSAGMLKLIRILLNFTREMLKGGLYAEVDWDFAKGEGVDADDCVSDAKGPIIFAEPDQMLKSELVMLELPSQ
ncbi:hypothetical protein GH754_04745 [Salinibacillus xinjiangensis]|uniref:Uncharacterized protein n=2 Tax=Salinibacillus xinjiangensis TaxID=1229268 RepID=A0A6G1X430_9BACI|nr:hypothetical protein [Salinibacillus xinjiangensis]